MLLGRFFFFWIGVVLDLARFFSSFGLVDLFSRPDSERGANGRLKGMFGGFFLLLSE